MRQRRKSREAIELRRLASAPAEQQDLTHVDTLAQDLSCAAMVFRKRAFHYYFIRLVASLACAEMAFFAEAVVAFLAGLSAIQGDMSTGSAATLIALVKLLASELRALVEVH